MSAPSPRTHRAGPGRAAFRRIVAAEPPLDPGRSRHLDMQGLADELGMSAVWPCPARVAAARRCSARLLWSRPVRAGSAAARSEAERPEGGAPHAGQGRASTRSSSRWERLSPGCSMTARADHARARRPRRPGPGRHRRLRRGTAAPRHRRRLVTLIEPDALAYALVKLGESFLYADVLAARKPDVETANRLQRALVEGILP